MTRVRVTDSPDTRILIRAANWVGDAIMTTPVIRGVRRSFPRSRITVLAKPWVVPVYADNPHLNEVMVYEAAGRHKMGVGTLRLAKELRQQRFDLAILMQNAFEAALLAFIAGIPWRVGYNTDGRTVLLNPAIRLDPALKQGHLIDYYLGILTGAGWTIDGRQMDLPVPAKALAEARHLIWSLGFGKGGRRGRIPLIGINPGAEGGTAKRWFPERYAALCRRLSRRYTTRVLIVGSPTDQPVGEAIAAWAPECCVNLAGRTTLALAFAVIQCCDLFVTNDSGLMHAAAALRVPVVAVIGPTHPTATAPDSPCATRVREPLACSPCLKKECPKDRRDPDFHQCMARISVDRVFSACQDRLSLRGKPGKPGRPPSGYREVTAV